MSFTRFIIGNPEPPPFRSQWRKDFDAYLVEEKRNRKAGQATVLRRHRVVVHRGPDRTPRKSIANPCVRQCGRNSSHKTGVCWTCRRTEELTVRRRLCIKACGTQLYSKSSDICSTCRRKPKTERRICASECGRLMRADSQHDTCKPCRKRSRAEDPASHPVACVVDGCRQQTRNQDRVCWRCKHSPKRYREHQAKTAVQPCV